MNTKKIINDLKTLQKNFPDLIIRKIKLSYFKYIYIITTDSLSSGDRVNDFILKYFSNNSIINKDIKNIKKNINSYIPSINLKEVTSYKDLLYFLYSGFSIILTPELDIGYAFETRAEIDRGITEPSSEPTVKGPKDSLTENYQKNVGVIRKRIKSTSLHLKEINVGRYTKAKTGIFYINGIAEDEVVKEVIDKIKSIDIDGVLDVTYFKELIRNENKTIFPTIISTEKPDSICKNLLDGKVVVILENSPFALIIPTFFISYFQNSEDYDSKAFFSTFIRIIRIFAFWITILMPAIYLAVTTYDQEIIPTSLLVNFAIQRENVPFPAIVEALILLLTFEILNESDNRTPSSRTTSLSILGALVLGEAAVTAGIISPIMVIVIAITSVCSLLFGYLDIQAPIRFWRYILMFFGAFFGIIGIFVGLGFMLTNMCSIKSFGKPYLLPYAPFYVSGQSNAILRLSLNNLKKRRNFIAKNNNLTKLRRKK